MLTAKDMLKARGRFRSIDIENYLYFCYAYGFDNRTAYRSWYFLVKIFMKNGLDGKKGATAPFFKVIPGRPAANAPWPEEAITKIDGLSLASLKEYLDYFKGKITHVDKASEKAISALIGAECEAEYVEIWRKLLKDYYKND